MWQRKIKEKREKSIRWHNIPKNGRKVKAFVMARLLALFVSKDIFH